MFNNGDDQGYYVGYSQTLGLGGLNVHVWGRDSGHRGFYSRLLFKSLNY